MTKEIMAIRNSRNELQSNGNRETNYFLTVSAHLADLVYGYVMNQCHACVPRAKFVVGYDGYEQCMIPCNNGISIHVDRHSVYLEMKSGCIPVSIPIIDVLQFEFSERVEVRENGYYQTIENGTLVINGIVHVNL